MSEHLYEASIVKSMTAAGAVCEIIPATLAAGKRPPEIRELGIWVNSPAASVSALGIGRPAAAGVTPGTETTVQSDNGFDTVAGSTLIAASWGTGPTSPSPFHRRFDLQAIAGAGVIFTWDEGELVLWSGAAVPTFVVWQFGAITASYDLYVKVAE